MAESHRSHIFNKCFSTTLIPVEETVSWKIHGVSQLLRTNTWTAHSIPMEVGLGPLEVSRWNISLQTRNANSVLCARAMLLSPEEADRRVTHRLRVAMLNEADDGGASPVYYFPTNPNNNTSNSLNNLTTDDNSSRCISLKRLRRLLFSSKLDRTAADDDDVNNKSLGDGRTAKEARPGQRGHPSLWKIAPLDKIEPDEQDCIELRVSLIVYGCDVVAEEER